MTTHHRRLIAVPPEAELIRIGVTAAIREKLAEDVIDGKVIHNLETDEICIADGASPEFRTQAIAAYVRMIDEMDAE